MGGYSRRYSDRFSGNYYGFAPYVPVAERRRKAAKEVAKLAKKGKTITPVEITGRKIANSFWGKAWCDNLEAYSDYENRLPRGRTYVRNGSVVHLEIRNGEIEAIVSGSSLYKISISITPVARSKWQALCKECAGGIGSLVELLQAKLSDRVMTIISRPDNGLFPSPKEIKMKCSCPDTAGLCKHLAATLYGIGSQLDHKPELLFLLRSVDSADLISQAANLTSLQSKSAADGGPELDDDDISSIFGIEIESSPAAPPQSTPARKSAAKKTTAKKTAAKKTTAKKTTAKKTAAKKTAAKKTFRKSVQPSAPKTSAKKAAVKKPAKKAAAKKAAAKRKRV
jgi:uncharacterized Zn finger protein